MADGIMYSPTYKNLNPGSYAVASPDGTKRHMVSGPPPRRVYAPQRDSPPLPGLSSMLQQQQRSSQDSFLLSPRTPPKDIILKLSQNHPVPQGRVTPSTSSEDDPVFNATYPAKHETMSPTDLLARKVAATTVVKTLATTAPNGKSSRYLREIDRRAILSRIEQGEKQSALAKEYQVSRAAICNLNKHRDEVLSRKDSNPLAKHPKKPRPKTIKAKLCKSGWATAMAMKENAMQEQNGVYEIKSRAAALLLTTLRKKHATVHEFHRSSDRLMRIVMEEALAHVPVKTVEIFLPNHTKSDGVALEHPPCAISMEPAGCPMLDLFHLIEPDQPTGYVSFGDISPSASQTGDVQAKICGNRLPSSLNYHNVFIMDHVVTSAQVVIAVVRRLQEHGAVEAMISLVALIATPEAVEKVHAVFPALKIVVAQVDNTGEMAAPSPVGHADASRASTTDMILDRLEQVYHGLSPATPY